MYLPAFQTWCATYHFSMKALIVKAILLVYHANYIICLTLKVTIGLQQPSRDEVTLSFCHLCCLLYFCNSFPLRWCQSALIEEECICAIFVYTKKKKNKSRERSSSQLANLAVMPASEIVCLLCLVISSYNIKLVITNPVSRVSPVVLTLTFHFWDHSLEFLLCLHAT